LKWTRQKAAQVAESLAPPELPKEPSAMRILDGPGSLALEVGSQGALIRLTKVVKATENQG